MGGVIFSCAHRLGGEGSSRPLSHVWSAVQGSQRALLISPETFGARLSELGRLGDGLGPAFDDLAQVEIVEAHTSGRWTGTDLFIGSGGASLHQLEWGPRGRRVTLWFSSHWAHADRVLRGEYPHYGISAAPIHPYVAWRAAREQELSDCLVVPSAFCRDTYPEELRGKVRVVEFGVDSERFCPGAERQGHRTREVPLRVLFPATNPPRKGLRFVLEALHGLPKDRFQLTVTGGLKMDWGQLGEGMPPVVTTGWVGSEDMLRLYQDHDLLLLPSLEEGQALAVLEAAACGMPSIVTPNVGYGEAVTDFGWEVPAYDARTLRATLEMVERGREHALQGASRSAREWAVSRPWSGFEHGIRQVASEVMG